MYKKMYYHLFNKITDALNESDFQRAREILMNAQRETEEIYINEADENDNQ